MEQKDLKKLKLKMIYLYPLTFIILAAMFFLPAGSLNFWQAWVVIFILLVPALFVMIYFLKKSPEFLARRMKYKEKELEQKMIIKIGNIFFAIGFLLPGFDFRYGWSKLVMTLPALK